MQNWLHSIAATRTKYEQLSAETKQSVSCVINEIMLLKEEMLNLTNAKGSADICRSCGGNCCNYGKFHVSVLDFMACILTSRELPLPDFKKHPLCPYCLPEGCSMPPHLRPMTCVLFNCDLVDMLLNDIERTKLIACERLLREKVASVEQLLDYRVGRPLLLSIE